MLNTLELENQYEHDMDEVELKGHFANGGKKRRKPSDFGNDLENQKSK